MKLRQVNIHVGFLWLSTNKEVRSLKPMPPRLLCFKIHIFFSNWVWQYSISHCINIQHSWLCESVWSKTKETSQFMDLILSSLLLIAVVNEHSNCTDTVCLGTVTCHCKQHMLPIHSVATLCCKFSPEACYKCMHKSFCCLLKRRMWLLSKWSTI